MTIRIININGQKLVAGLLWQNLSDTGNPKREIRSVGHDLEADMVCVPAVRNPIQAGYLSKADLAGEKSVKSLAAGLVENNRGSWLGMFSMPDDPSLFYYIAVQNDHILASSDIVGPLDEIKSLFEQTLSAGGWQYVTVPSEFNYPGSTVNHYNLHELLVNIKAPKIRSLEFRIEDISIVKTLAVLSVVSILGGGWYEYDRQEQIKELARIAEQQRLMNIKKVAAEVIPPWVTATPINAFILNCRDNWETVKYSIVGWEAVSWSCDSKQVSLTYKKSPMASTVDLMHAYPNISLGNDGKQAFITTPSNVVGKGSVPAMRGKIAKATLMDYAERHKMTILFEAVAPPVVLPGDKKNGENVPPPPPWTMEIIKIDTSYSIAELNGLNKIPGLIIKKISSAKNGPTWGWHVDGEVYVAK